jgi:lipid-A-disaccharide synthase-like uncharacterized protein
MTIIASYFDRLGDSLTPWAVLGFCGQAIFAARFVVQWMHSERVGRSEIPLLFWYISLVGGTTTLLYAIHIANAVFILGQASGLLVYARNLHLIFRERRAAASAVR